MFLVGGYRQGKLVPYDEVLLATSNFGNRRPNFGFKSYLNALVTTKQSNGGYQVQPSMQQKMNYVQFAKQISFLQVLSCESATATSGYRNCYSYEAVRNVWRRHSQFSKNLYGDLGRNAVTMGNGVYILGTYNRFGYQGFYFWAILSEKHSS